MDPWPSSPEIGSERLSNALRELQKAPEGKVGSQMIGVLEQVHGVQLNIPGVRDYLQMTGEKYDDPLSGIVSCTGDLYINLADKSRCLVMIEFERLPVRRFTFSTHLPTHSPYIQDKVELNFTLDRGLVSEGKFEYNESGRTRHSLRFSNSGGYQNRIYYVDEEYIPPDIRLGHIRLPPLLSLMTTPGKFLKSTDPSFQDMLDTFLIPPSVSPAV